MWTLVITRQVDRATGSVSKVTRTSEKGFDWDVAGPNGGTDGTWTFTSHDLDWNAVFTGVVSIEETFTGEDKEEEEEEDKDESMTKKPASAPDEFLPRASAHE